MSGPGTIHPIAIVGAGPAAVFAAEALLKHESVHVDVFERLVAPFGLVRYGVAPDHQKIKQVEAGFTKTLGHERVRYFGNVSLEQDVSLQELLHHYDQVVFGMGCQAARPLGVVGEGVAGVHSALEVVSWYNGHPDYVERAIDLSASQVAIVGAGDVSIDLVRLLVSSPSELAATDMPGYALAAFAQKRTQHIHVLVRRGPASAGFALKELRGVLERPNVRPACDESLLAEALADSSLPRTQREKLEYLLHCCQRAHSEPETAGAADPVQLHFHFLRAPVEFIERGGRVSAVKVEHTRLQVVPGGEPRALGTGQFEELAVQFAALATGYRGEPLPSVPLDPRTGLVPNTAGQVLNAEGQPDARQYVVGWLKRGPQGVIGTNKADARETVEQMIQNLPTASKSLPPMTELLETRGVRFVSFAAWQQLDELERQRGAALGKPREKWLSASDALQALSVSRLATDPQP